MAITIHYTIRLARASDVPTFLTAARAEARRRKWKVDSSKAADAEVTIFPHAKCEALRVAFTSKLLCEEFVKTGFAPVKCHVAIVEFLRALQPLAKRMTVEDEGEYWDTSDLALLKRHREGFDGAFAKAPQQSGGVQFTLGAMTIQSLPDGSMKIAKGPGKVVNVAKPVRRRDDSPKR